MDINCNVIYYGQRIKRPRAIRFLLSRSIITKYFSRSSKFILVEFSNDRILSWRTRIGTNRISLIWFKPIIGEILILVVVYPLFVDVGWFIRDTSIRTRRETVSSAKKGWITFLKLAQLCVHGCFTMIYHTEDI